MKVNAPKRIGIGGNKSFGIGESGNLLLIGTSGRTFDYVVDLGPATADRIDLIRDTLQSLKKEL